MLKFFSSSIFNSFPKIKGVAKIHESDNLLAKLTNEL